MENTKLTKSAIYAQMIAYFNGEDVEMTTDAMATFCANEKAILDKKAAKAKETAAKKRAEGDALTDAVRAVLSAEEFEPIAEIAARIEGEDVTVSKVTYRLTQLVKNGEAEKQEITVAGGEGQKSRKIQGYRIIAQ